MLPKNFEYKVHPSLSDPEGNYLLLDIHVTAYNNRFTLASLYDPNVDNPGFFQAVTEKISQFKNNYVVWCGDFNLVQDPKVDYKTINNKNAREKVLEIIIDQHLVDSIRDTHPELKRYKWITKQPLQQARLDFFLISEDLLPSVKNVL